MGGPRAAVRAVAVITIGLLALLPGATPMAAQAVPDPSGLGPPDWVRPGTRITSYLAAASVAQSYYQLIEDPDGSWQDPTTGKRYRKTDETGEGVGGGSGDGLLEIDVIALDGTQVVLSSTRYGIDRNTGILVITPGAGLETAGGAIDGLWVHPSTLADLKTGSLGGLLVLRGPYMLGDQAYDAVSVVNPTPGAYASWTWDTVTGVLLASTTNTQGAGSPVGINGQAPPQGNTYLTIGRLLGTRDVAVPGIGAAVPAWASRPVTLSYAGRYDWANPVNPASAAVTAPMVARLEVSPGGASWVGYRLTTRIQYPGLDTPAVLEGVAGGTGPYWWDPAALATFKAGESLDVDPFTQASRVVSGIDQGPAGPAVTISTRLPGGGSDVSYDLATGVMVRYAATSASDGSSVDLRIEAMP